jgi:hypothetical protein
LESGQQILECDLCFHNTGEFSLIKQKEDGTPEMINGILSADKFFEFNNLINREVFYVKMSELCGKNVITPNTKRVEKMYLKCSYEDEEKNEETELLYDVNPFNGPIFPEVTSLTFMVADIYLFILQNLVPSEPSEA